MSCQSLAPARAFTETEKEIMTHCGSYHRSVRFSSESQSSTRPSTESECRRETPGSISLTALTVTSLAVQHPTSEATMSQSAPSAYVDFADQHAPPLPSGCRFPKLEECAHFHYERVSLGGLRIETVPTPADGELSHTDTNSLDGSTVTEGWICLKIRSHINESSANESLDVAGTRSLNTSWTAERSDVCEWTLTRNAQNFLQLDDMLHRCIYDRKVSGLSNLSEEITASLLEDRMSYECLISDYVHHFSIIADDSINCGPILNWLQMDNKGHRLLVANEDSSSINTPAVAAAYSVRKYVSQARDEISFEVGDMISIIDMPGPQESLWWRGKRGFRVGFFPHHCVAVIGDKVPRHMTQPPPIVGSVAMAPIKPVLRKHGKLISLFRSFILSRPSRRSLKQQGILRERVFGCDLGEHLLNCGHDVPLVLVECASVIEQRGAVDGIYRLSGGSGLTQRLRAAFDEGRAPDLTAPAVQQDVHAVASLLKMYFRELPNPLCTYQLYESFVYAVQPGPDEPTRLRRMRETVVKLPPPHYRTLSYLMRHLRRVSLLGSATGMTARNMAIVWAPNLLRSPRAQHALQGVAVQAVVTEFLICYAEELFSQEQGADSGPDSLDAYSDDSIINGIELRGQGHETARRPKSLPLNAPTKLLSLEEARRRGGCTIVQVPHVTASLPPPSGAIAAAAQANAQLRPSAHLQPKYIEVGSGPNNLPQYHTVLELPAQGIKRGLKRSPSGWRGLFSRSKQQRQRSRVAAARAAHSDGTADISHRNVDIVVITSIGGSGTLRPVKSCESLQSETDALGPLSEQKISQVKHHTRSASCDSYFEPWQVELADMRLRLSPQERDGNIFSEEDDTTLNVHGGLQPGSACSSPAPSDLCSVGPSPRRGLRVDIVAATVHSDNLERKRTKLEEQLSSIGYIDGAESPARHKPAAEKRHSDEWPTQPSQVDDAKRLCKDRDSPMSSLVDFQTSIANVKLRERSSPRKVKPSSRYSGMHHPLTNLPQDNDMKIVTIVNQIGQPSRVSWHGAKDTHSTLIKIDWPIENSSVNSLTASTLNSSPLTPVTPVYDPLESDSETSDYNKQMIEIKTEKCNNCDDDKKCLKCELTECDYNTNKPDFKIGLPVKQFGTEPKDEESKLQDSLEGSPTNISYQNLNRLSNISTNSSNSETNSKERKKTDAEKKIMTTSHESSSSYSNISPLKATDELYECYGFSRPNYINLSSSTSKSSSTSPTKSPLRSTISITFKSPKGGKAERDSVYEDVELDKNLSIVEEATVPDTDASLPTQQAYQPENFTHDLIIFETPNDSSVTDVYSQVKFFKRSIEEVNALISNKETKTANYENVPFPKARELKETNHYENVNIIPMKNCDIESKRIVIDKKTNEHENGNVVKTVKNLNVRQLANRFESPTEQKGPFSFKTEVKYLTLDRKKENNIDRTKSLCESRKKDLKIPPPVSPKTYKLSKNSVNARSLDENAFIKEFGCENKKYVDRRKSLEVRETKKQTKYFPDLNLNMEEEKTTEERITPTSENKISLVQRLTIKPVDLSNFDAEKKLSRERIEKYKEERRNFLREKYGSQSFRSINPGELTRIKVKKQDENERPKELFDKEVELRNSEKYERLKDEDDLPKFERRNTVDLGQRMRFSLTRSVNNLDSISPRKSDESCPKEPRGDSSKMFETAGRSGSGYYERREKMSPSYNIKDMAAMFEQKSQNNAG